MYVWTTIAFRFQHTFLPFIALPRLHTVQAAGIQGRVTEVMRGALARAADPKEPMAPGDLLRLAATVRVLEALAPVSVKVSICKSRPTVMGV